MIYDQQQIAAFEMSKIERSIKKLRDNFTRAVIKQEGYLTSTDEVDALFTNKAKRS
tara:strand:+ start:1443 stop:1610 length:168 start_codon:yes stop_codon:yes gene_type:complete